MSKLCGSEREDPVQIDNHRGRWITEESCAPPGTWMQVVLLLSAHLLLVDSIHEFEVLCDSLRLERFGREMEVIAQPDTNCYQDLQL